MMWALSLARWRPPSGWVLTTIAFVLLGVGDPALALRGAQGSFVRGELTSTCFPLAMLALGLAATRPPPPRLDEPVVSLRLLAFPAPVLLAAWYARRIPGRGGRPGARGLGPALAAREPGALPDAAAAGESTSRPIDFEVTYEEDLLPLDEERARVLVNPR
jgi:hypothetical protein